MIVNEWIMNKHDVISGEKKGNLLSLRGNKSALSRETAWWPGNRADARTGSSSSVLPKMKLLTPNTENLSASDHKRSGSVVLLIEPELFLLGGGGVTEEKHLRWSGPEEELCTPEFHIS